MVNTILGLAHLKGGNIAMGGAQITKPRTYMAAQKGIAVVPQGRCIIANLSVEENLTLGAAVGRKGPWNVPEIYKLFPILQERAHTPGTALSGGQQQMLAVGRALMSNPSLILLDEPTEGLAPVIVDQLGVIFNQVADKGTALLPMLEGGAAALDAYEQHARKLGLIMSTEDAAAADVFGDALADLWKVLKMSAFAVGAALGLLHHEADDHADRLHVPAAQLVGHVRVGLQRGGDDRSEGVGPAHGTEALGLDDRVGGATVGDEPLEGRADGIVEGRERRASDASRSLLVRHDLVVKEEQVDASEPEPFKARLEAPLERREDLGGGDDVQASGSAWHGCGRGHAT